MSAQRVGDANRSRYERKPNERVQSGMLAFDEALGRYVVVTISPRARAKERERAAIMRRGRARNLREIALVLGVDVTNLHKDDPTIRRYIQQRSACRYTMNVRALTLDDWTALDAALMARRAGSEKKSKVARGRARGAGAKRGVRSTFAAQRKTPPPKKRG